GRAARARPAGAVRWPDPASRFRATPWWHARLCRRSRRPRLGDRLESAMADQPRRLRDLGQSVTLYLASPSSGEEGGGTANSILVLGDPEPGPAGAIALGLGSEAFEARLPGRVRAEDAGRGLFRAVGCDEPEGAAHLRHQADAGRAHQEARDPIFDLG